MENLEDKIREFLDNNGIYYNESSRSFTLQCPECNDYKLYISKEEGNFVCFKCQDSVKGGYPEIILSELTNEPQSKIKRFLRGFEYIQNIDLASITKESTIIKKEVPQEAKFLPRDFLPINHPKAKEGLQYLENNRGIPEFLAIEMDVMYSEKYKQVIFPVYDGNIYVGYQGRCIQGKNKYNDVSKSQYLMFEKTIHDNRVALAEGPISSLKFASSGIGFVATMGKAVSEKQIERLTKLGVDTIYLALDRDAYKEIQAFYDKYYRKFKIYLVEVPEGIDDFGDCTFDQCNKAIENSVELNRMTFLPGVI